MRPRRTLPILLAVAVGAGLLIGPGRAEADELTAKMTKLAEGLKAQFGRRETSVAVGDFVAAARLEASGGPAIANALIEALKTVGLGVDKKAVMEITGRYSKAVDEKTKLTAIRIKCQIVDTSTGADFASLDVSLVDPATVMRLAGGSGDISGATLKERSAKVNENLEKPKVHLDPANTRISAAPGSPYAVEILVGSGDDARPRAATVDDGKARLHIRDDEVYAVRLINDSDLASVVNLSIDGLSMFAFADEPAERTNLIVVKPHDSATIRGWYRNARESNEFLVAELAKSAAAKQVPSSSASIGTISATFSVAWERGTTPPPGEEDSVIQKGDSATALGKKIDQPFERVDFQFGKPKVVVSVRYNKAVEPGNLPK